MPNARERPSPADALIRQARFIFRGTIRQLAAANLSAVRASESTAIVTVDEVLQAPATLGDQTGREITVQLGEAGRLQPGQQAVFFTNGWLYGESIAVQEVGRREAGEEETARLARDIADVQQRAADEELRRRIELAELVVAGRMSNVQLVAQRRVRISEHDPQWWRAVIAVRSVEKGRLQQPVVVLLYPSSIDVMWYRAPKFHAGQEGIWLLQRAQVEGLDGEAYTALDPLDFHPPDQIERIRRLL